MILAFKLSMPGRGSWNGGWTGADRIYAVTRKANKPDLVGDHFYSWSDGWTACVTVSIVDSREAAKIRRKSDGFNGYDWMVDSLLVHGCIKSAHDMRAEVAK